MKKIKCFLVDDEPRAINTLQYLIETYCFEEAVITGVASNVADALEQLSIEVPDLLFLDINLGSNTGFDLLEMLQADSDMQVCMVTAYDNYALKAYQFNVGNYLLKPVNYEELKKVIHKVYQLCSALANQEAIVPRHKIFLPDRNGWISFLLPDILYLEADNVYTKIYDVSGKVDLISKNLGYIQQQYLSSNPEFLRVQKSFIINTKHITRINNNIKCTVTLTNGTTIPISNSMKKELFDLFIG